MMVTAPPKFEGRKKEVFGKFLSKSENTKSKVILISNFALFIITMIYNGFTFSKVFLEAIEEIGNWRARRESN